MASKANVFLNNKLAGTLEKKSGEYLFSYANEYFNDKLSRPISATFPMSQKEFHSQTLFPFFFNMLSEGANKDLQCRNLKIDEDDYFTLLLKTAHTETIGAVTVVEYKD